jgi:hypothetical protein
MRLTLSGVDFKEIIELTHTNVQGLLYRGEVMKNHKYERKSFKGADLRKKGAQTDDSV